MAHVFISYSTSNGTYANRLAEKLRQEGFDVWIDNDRLRSSDNWWEAIVYALRSCAALVVIMTPEARQSRWVQRETTLADNWRKPTFPLLLDGDNWEIYVLTQYRDVRNGTIPPAEFFDKLAEYAPRQSRPGRIITTSKRPTRKGSTDAELLAEIRNPPVQAAPSGDIRNAGDGRSKHHGCLLGTLFRTALILIGVGILVAAVLWFAGILDESPPSSPPGNLTAQEHVERAWQSWQRRDADAAFAEINTAIELDPGLGEAYWVRGVVLLETGNPEAAVGEFEHALELGVESRFEVLNGLVNALIATDNPDALNHAFDIVNEMGRLNPDSPLLHGLRGDIFYAQRRWPNTKAIWNEAENRQPISLSVSRSCEDVKRKISEEVCALRSLQSEHGAMYSHWSRWRKGFVVRGTPSVW